jgi:hypothetical protein
MAEQEAAAKAVHETMLRRELDAAAIEREGVVADEWERFELRCVFRFAPLTDPAEGSACMHRACFNYDVLLIWDSLIWVYMGTARASTTTCF